MELSVLLQAKGFLDRDKTWQIKKIGKTWQRKKQGLEALEALGFQIHSMNSRWNLGMGQFIAELPYEIPLSTATRLIFFRINIPSPWVIGNQELNPSGGSFREPKFIKYP